MGSDFFSHFDFYTGADPTHGTAPGSVLSCWPFNFACQTCWRAASYQVQFIDENTAWNDKLISNSGVA